jgi:transcription antitermination factor NusA-like protein
VGTILSDLGLESPLVGTTVTAHIKSSGPDGFRCTVYDAATGEAREAVLPRADAYDLPDGAAPPALGEGDTLIALVVGVDGTERLMLSATAPELVERILAAFVDEILTGSVVVKGIARVAGAQTKIAVAPTVQRVDAKGACIGRGASRLKAAEALLNRGFGREKLEIIEYAADRARFLANAVNPATAVDLLIDGDNAVVAVEPHQLRTAIGEGGLNAQLAGRLTGLYVHVVTAGTDLRRALDELAAERHPA